MKKILISLAVMAAAAAAIVAVSAENRLDDQFEANLEALAQHEIIVGPLCMVAPNYACTSLGEVFKEHYPA